MAERAPIDFKIAISRTLESTIIVREAMMLNAATTMISTNKREMITFCMVSAMKRLWFSSFQSTIRWGEPRRARGEPPAGR